MNECNHHLISFTWDGQTLCRYCCAHDYKSHIATYQGITFCALCSAELDEEEQYYYGSSRTLYSAEPEQCYNIRRAPPPHKKKKKIPKILLFDENGKQRRVKYHSSQS